MDPAACWEEGPNHSAEARVQGRQDSLAREGKRDPLPVGLESPRKYASVAPGP